MDYRWVAQDARGEIWKFQLEPTANTIHNGFYTGGDNEFVEKGKPNPNWRDSLIDLEKEDFAIVDGTLIRKPKAKKKLTDAELLNAIEEYRLIVDRNVWSKNAITVWNRDDFTGATSEKGDIRKAIKKWLKKNVDKKELTE